MLTVDQGGVPWESWGAHHDVCGGRAEKGGVPSVLQDSSEMLLATKQPCLSNRSPIKSARPLSVSEKAH